MTLARFNPELGTLRTDSFSNLLDRFFNETVNSSKLAGFTPRVDVWETETGYEFEMALPGLQEDDIQIDFQEGRLTVSGERKFEREENQQRYHLLETQYGSFTRSFNLPDNVSPERIEAEFNQGLLRITVPKDEKKVQKHQIQVNSGQGKSIQSAGKGKSNGQKQQTVKV